MDSGAPDGQGCGCGSGAAVDGSDAEVDNDDDPIPTHASVVVHPNKGFGGLSEAAAIRSYDEHDGSGRVRRDYLMLARDADGRL